MTFPIRPNIESMRPYSPGKPSEEVARELGIAGPIKLASNENPLGPSPKAVEAVQQEAKNIHLYPDAAGWELKTVLTHEFDVDIDHIALGNGSDDLISLIGQVFLGKASDEVIVGDPSFVRYNAAAELAPCKLIKVPVNQGLGLDLVAMGNAVTERTKLIFLANPNNPTGTIFRDADLDDLLRQLPSDTIVVLDEAYAEFANHEPGYPNGLDYVKRNKRIVLLRTFSKTYGLAGIRIGALVAHPEIVDAINRVRQPFAVNRLAQVAAIAAIQDREYLSRTVAHTRAQVEFLTNTIKAFGWRAIPSFANFVLADLGHESYSTYEKLLQQGIIVRPGRVLGLPNTLRISVGTNEEMQAFAHALELIRDNRVTY